MAWSIVSGSSVSVDAATGVVTALANGASTVRATSGTATGDVVVNVAQLISASRSVVTASPTTLAANGTSTSTLTVQLRDANDVDIPVGGATVTLAQSPAISTIGAVTDNANGSYSATLTAGTVAGATNVSAVVNGQTLSTAAVVSFTGAAASQYLVSVSPSSPPVAGATVTVTARIADANGNAVATAGNVVTWSSTGGGSFSAPTSITDASGSATVTFTTSTTATPHSVTATTGALTGTSQLIVPQAGAAAAYVVAPSTTSPAAGSAVSVSAQLVDANNNALALAGQTVTWTKSAANGSFSAATSLTNAQGIAVITLNSHTVSGTTTTVTATTGALSGTSAAITTVAGPAAQLLVIQAPTASPQSGVAFPAQPSIQLRDAQGNDVSTANVSVTASMTSGSGALTGSTIAQTNTSGLATFSDLAISGLVGAKTLTFAVSGVGSATAGITLTAGPATQIILNAGNNQTATVGGTVATPPSVVVRDAAGNPVVSVDVTFTVTAGAGVTVPASGTAVPTDASGVASLGSWTLGTSAGANSLEATVASASLIGEPVTFTATATVGSATQIVAQSALTQTATVGTAVSAAPSVLVHDASNNPIPNFSVTFALTASGGAGGAISSPATVLTNASGIATLASWTVGQAAGTNNNTVTATGAGLGTITFNASGVAGAAQNIIANSATSQSATVATSVTAPSVIVRDAYNNPVAGVPVAFALTASGGAGGAIGAATPLTDANGVASLASWTLGQSSGTGNNIVTASVAGLTGSPVTFIASGTAGNAASLVANSAVSQSAAVGTAVAAPPSVIVRDQFNNPVGAGVNVTFAVTAAANGGTIDPAATVPTNAAGIATLTSWTLGTAAGTANNTVTATIPALNVVTFNASGTAGSATQIVIATQPSATATAGVPFTQQPVLELRDAQNNLVTNNNSTVVTATRLGGAGSLQGTTTATAVGGVVAFTNLAHSTGSTITIQFTAGGLTSATSNNLIVSGPDHYIVTVPATAAAGTTVIASAQLVDAGNTPVAISNRTVSWTSNTNGGALFAGGAQFSTPTSSTDATGRAEIAYTVPTTAGNTHAIRATDNTALVGTSTNLTVVAAAPAQLAFAVQPADVEANAVMSPAVDVEVHDAFGNLVLADPNAGATETVSLAFTTGTNTEGAALSATLPQAINWTTGRATFADISVNLAGNYGFTASETGFAAVLTDATSNDFDVLATTATISASTNLTEAALNSGTLTVQITNGTFAAPTVADFALVGAPAGVTIAGVTPNGSTEVLLDLDFDGTDFDAVANTAVNVLASALATGTPASTNTAAVAPTAASSAVLSGPATIEANAVSGAITLEAREANGTSMTVGTAEEFALSSNSPGSLQFSLNPDGSSPTTTATIPSGATGTTFYYRDDAQGSHLLTAADGADEGAALGSPAHGIQVLTPSAAITATNPGSLTETNLDGATVTVTLTNATYDAVIGAADFSLATAPAGTSILSVNRVSNTVAVLTLDYDLTDFDAATTISVNVLAGALASGVPVATGTVAVAPDAANAAALSGPATVEANAVTGAITLEARETNGTPMIVGANEAFTLTSTSGGQFSTNADGSGVTTTFTIPSGSASTTLFYRDPTPGSFTLTATDGADDGAALGAPTHNILVLASTAAITGTTPTPLAESTLNGATVTVTLTDGTFAASLAADGSDFSLANFPPGTAISAASRSSATVAIITLSFVGSGGAPQNLSINVLASALATGTPATTGTVPVTNDVP
ncbi:MAG TPA: invasin domain 3-containing protein [Gemmatimonadaceae bacterium]|nr:invasin domain 3-containing protein [Gemmatimonadaceae bacterium]